MSDWPKKETLQIEFKSDPVGGLSDKSVADAVVGLANAQGGVLYIGIDDNGTISGLRSEKWRNPKKAAAFISNYTVPPLLVETDLVPAEKDRWVLTIKVPKAQGLCATRDGKVLRRRIKVDGRPENIPMFPQEYSGRLSELGLLDYSAQVLPESSYADIDAQERNRLRKIIRANRGESALLELADEDLDKALGVVRAVDGKLRPTVAGLLLLGKKESIATLLPTSKVAFQVLTGTDVRDNIEVQSPLLSTFEELLYRFSAWNPEQEFQEGLFRVPVPEFSERAFREGIVNALCHRDYTRLGSVVVQVSNEGLLILSPGGFIDDITQDNLLTADPHGRNPLLSDMFKRIGLAERTGRGIDRIFEGSILYGRPLPDYSESTSDSVHLFIPRMKADFNFHRLILSCRENHPELLTMSTLMILSLLRSERRLALPNLVELCHLSAVRVQRQIEILLKEGFIEAVGTGKNQEYILSEAVYKAQDQTIRNVNRSDLRALRLEELVLGAATKNEGITRSDVVGLLHINAQAAYRLLLRLTEQGKLRKEGKRCLLYTSDAADE